MSEPMPWPKRPDPMNFSSYEEVLQAQNAWNYARYEAAIARLRVAKEALELYAHCVANTHVTADKALSAIGDLPND